MHVSASSSACRLALLVAYKSQVRRALVIIEVVRAFTSLGDSVNYTSRIFVQGHRVLNLIYKVKQALTRVVKDAQMRSCGQVTKGRGTYLPRQQGATTHVPSRRGGTDCNPEVAEGKVVLILAVGARCHRNGPVCGDDVVYV